MPKLIFRGGLSQASNQDEVRNLVNDLREYCVDEYRKRFRVTTAGTGTLTTIWSQDMPDQAAWRVTVDATGRATAGGSGRASYTRTGLFYRDGGGATQQGAITGPVTIESAAAMGVLLSVSGNAVMFQVQDDGVLTMNWVALVRIEEV